MNWVGLMGDTPRSRCYLQNLISQGFTPCHLYIFDPNSPNQKNTLDDCNHYKCPLTHLSFNFKHSIISSCIQHQIPYTIINNLDPNSDEVFNIISHEATQNIVFSPARGTPFGSILKDKMLSLHKNFIHVHPGITPKYKGSTVMHYSLLNESKVGATVFYLTQGIDTGTPLHQIEYSIQQYPYNIDEVGEVFIRTQALIEFMSGKRSVFSSTDEQNTFYVIHPLLKHLSILKYQGDSDVSI